MATAGSIVLSLLLVASSDAFLTPGIARTNALRQSGSKLSHIPSNNPVAGLKQLEPSSFVSGVSCSALRGEGSGGSGRGGLSMKVINVGVIGAGRYVVSCVRTLRAGLQHAVVQAGRIFEDDGATPSPRKDRR